jgi:hypothetical protein
MAETTKNLNYRKNGKCNFKTIGEGEGAGNREDFDYISTEY